MRTSRAPVAGLIAALLLAGSTAAAPAAPLDHPMLGDPAPTFTLPSLSGGEIALPDFRGKYLAIHFGTSW